jgi:serine/threonine protein kinase
MPREQIVNYKRVLPVSDVWSIAATAYYLLTGRPPRDFSEGTDRFTTVLTRPVVPIRQRDASVPERVARAIDLALIDDVTQRTRTADRLRAELAAAV